MAGFSSGLQGWSQPRGRAKSDQTQKPEPPQGLGPQQRLSGGRRSHRGDLSALLPQHRDREGGKEPGISSPSLKCPERVLHWPHSTQWMRQPQTRNLQPSAFVIQSRAGKHGDGVREQHARDVWLCVCPDRHLM